MTTACFTLRRHIALVVAATFVSAGQAAAQCPDGSPPPCAAPRAVPARRPDPSLDAGKWIVVPFDNLANSDETEWLRDASVNLLYLDLSRWKDIRVVDDERVADLVREVPTLKGGKPLTLATALTLAKHAGAGRLVMGDVVQLGSRTRLTAKIFDVKSGTRIRSAQQESVGADSLLSAYGRLAKDILQVAPPEGAGAGIVGTTRIDAYREYAAGLKALNRSDLDEAKRRFEASLKLDSLFALAHYKLASTALLGEVIPTAMNFFVGRDSTIQPHMLAAVRLGAALPVRERTLFAGGLAQIRSDHLAACDLYATLLRADSLDIEALMGQGECALRDETVEQVPGDTTRFRFRNSWNTSLRSFEKVLALDPTNHSAFPRIMLILTAFSREGCVRSDPAVPCNRTSHQALVRRSADSLLLEPIDVAPDEALRSQQVDRQTSGADRLNLDRAIRIAKSWVEAAPDESPAHAMLAHVLLLKGRVQDAASELAKVKGVPSGITPLVLADRVEIAIKFGRGVEANRLQDSLMTAASRSLRSLSRGQSTWFGRYRTSDSTLQANMPSEMKEIRVKIAQGLMRVFAGVAGDSALAWEPEYFDILSRFPATPQQRVMDLVLVYGLRLPRTRWPLLEYGGGADVVVAVAKGDTARVRSSARMLDSSARAAIRESRPDSAWSILAADGYLTLRDSASALTSLRILLDSAMLHTPITTSVPVGLSQGFMVGGLWPRAMLQRADLAAGLGLKAEARTWYGRFLDLWGKADPEFAPLLSRVRAAYVALGGTAPPGE